MIAAVDMFAGLGGWTAGAARTDAFDVRLAVNHCPDAIRWHRAAHGSTVHLHQDVAEVDWFAHRDELAGGVLIASPACQGFSEAGQPARLGRGGNGRVNVGELLRAHKGKRSTAMAVISAADVLEPRAVVVENVERFAGWRLFQPWLNMLRALGYSVRVHVLDASAYGAPQDRRRLIVTAHLGRPIDLAPSWGEPAGPVGDSLDADDDPANRWAEIDAKPERTRRRIRDEQRKAGLARGLLNNVSESRLRPLDGRAPTLTTQSGTQLMLVDYDRARIVNPGELARIQGWRPGECQLPASRKVASRLIGNAVPVPLAEGVLAQVAEAAA